jgi:hypothetical protein
MNYYFKSNDGVLKDILSDTVIKPLILVKITCGDMLLLTLSHKAKKEHESYIMLKYGDVMVNPSDIAPDRAPTIFKDYMPKDLKNKELLNQPRKF